MLVDPAFREEVLERQHVLRGSATVDGEHVRHRAGAVGRGACRRSPASSSATRSSSSSRSAGPHRPRPTCTCTIPGKPGDMQPAPSGSPRVGGGTPRGGRARPSGSRIPLVGGKIEKLVAEMLGQGARPRSTRSARSGWPGDAGARGVVRTARRGGAGPRRGRPWAPTGCAGWVVRDLVHHLHADAVRALVALHSPADGPADCDDVRYWADWGSDPDTDEPRAPVDPGGGRAVLLGGAAGPLRRRRPRRPSGRVDGRRPERRW